MKKALFAAAVILPPLCAFAVLATHWVAVPYWDDWGTPGEQLASWYRGTLTIAELFSQHNEHRRFFPRLFALAITSLVGWDVRYLMALLFAFVCTGAAALYALSQRTIAEQRVRLSAFAAMNFLLFSPREYETFLSGSILADLFVPAFAIVAAALMNLSRCSFVRKSIVNAALAFVSTYTFGNGMLVWLLAFPLEANGSERARQRTRIICRIAYLVAATLAVGCYFVGYHHPPLSPEPASVVRQPGDLLHYLLVWAGDLFLVSRPALFGAVIILLFAALALAAAALVKSGRDWRAHYPWILLGAYALISGCVTARSRLPLGFEGASHFHYTAVTVFLYIAVAGLAATVYSQLKARGRPMRFTIAIFAICFGTLWLTTLRREQRLVRATTAERRHLQLLMRWSEAIPDNPELALLSPYESTRATIRTLAAHDALRPKLIDAELAGAVATAPPLCDKSAGELERVSSDATGSGVVIRGSSQADYVVVGYETSDGMWKLLCVSETGGKDHRFRATLLGAQLTSEGKTFRAWGIDAARHRVVPLAGAVQLTASAP